MLTELLLSAALLSTPSNVASPVSEPDSVVCEACDELLSFLQDAFSDDSDEVDLLLSDADVAPINASSLSIDDLHNCLIIKARYNGSDRYLLFPDTARDALYIDPDGNLLNLSGSNVIGLLVNSNFNLTYDAYYVTIYSILNTSFSSQVYQHGSYIQMTHYYQAYQSGSYRLVNSTDYINLTNCEIIDTYSTGQQGRTNTLLTILVFLGGVLIVFGIFTGIGGVHR